MLHLWAARPWLLDRWSCGNGGKVRKGKTHFTDYDPEYWYPEVNVLSMAERTTRLRTWRSRRSSWTLARLNLWLEFALWQEC